MMVMRIFSLRVSVIENVCILMIISLGGDNTAAWLSDCYFLPLKKGMIIKTVPERLSYDGTSGGECTIFFCKQK